MQSVNIIKGKVLLNNNEYGKWVKCSRADNDTYKNIIILSDELDERIEKGIYKEVYKDSKVNCRYTCGQRCMNNNRIVGYIIVDKTNGQSKYIDSNKLREYMKSGKIQIDNLKLSKDSKILLDIQEA